MRELAKKIIDFALKLTTGSHSGKIFSAAITIGLLSIVVKSISFGKELIIAWRFGTSSSLDAFFIALIVPSFINNVLGNSFNSAFFPTFIYTQEKHGKNVAQKLFSGAVFWQIGLLSIVTILVVTSAQFYLPWIASGFDSEKLHLTVNLIYVISPFILLAGIASIWGHRLNAEECFSLPSISMASIPFVTAVLAFRLESLGIYALALGLVLGSLIEIIILGFGLRKRDISLRPRFIKPSDYMHKVIDQYKPMVVGSLLICSTDPIDQAMAAMLAPGSVASLNYGNRIVSALMSLISIALCTPIIPYFSKILANQDWLIVSRTFKRLIKMVFALTLPITIFLVVFSNLIVKLTFQRGMFTAEDTSLVSELQALYAMQIPFYIGDFIIVKMVSSLQKNEILAWISGLSGILNVILNLIFVQLFGLKGIVLSTCCVYLFSFLSMYLILNRFINKQLKLQNSSIAT